MSDPENPSLVQRLSSATLPVPKAEVRELLGVLRRLIVAAEQAVPSHIMLDREYDIEMALDLARAAVAKAEGRA